ncbi:MAG: RsmE family RNA methyltransferase [Planctomycetota bacterium]
MSHLKRFYVDALSPNKSFVTGDKVILDAAQSNHLKNTLRLKLHSTIEIFNNHNESYMARVSLIPQKGGVEVEILSEVTPKTIYVPDITLACAIAKGNRMDWLIEKTAEMGLTKLIPVITKRTVVKIDGLAPLERTMIRDKDKYISPHAVRELSNGLRSPENLLLHNKKIERWHKLAISAAKQTGQNSILKVLPPLEFNSLGNLIKDFSLSLIAVPNADKYLPEVLEKSNLSGKILYLIGPEGDFTPDEINAAMKWGVQPVRLPINAILRVETAAVTMLAMLLYHFGKTEKS